MKEFVLIVMANWPGSYAMIGIETFASLEQCEAAGRAAQEFSVVIKSRNWTCQPIPPKPAS